MGASRDFRDKTVVITGAAGGIGSAFAHRFGQAGAKLGLLDLSAEGLEALSADLRATGIDNVAVACDVTNPDDCQAAMAGRNQILWRHRRPDQQRGHRPSERLQGYKSRCLPKSYGCELLRLPVLARRRRWKA